MANMAEAVQIALQGVDNVSPAAKSAENSLNSLDGASTKLNSGFTSMAGAVGKATLALGAIAAVGVGAGLTAATNAAMGFEKQISAISAVTGASKADIEGLTATALQLGKDTSYSASEAAIGMEELAKAGVSIADIMGGAGRAALDLAAAGGIAVGDAAEIAANAMNVFNIEGENMAHVADVIAGAANASAIGVNDYKFSLAAAGAVAATVGVGFEDLSTAIAVMGQAGIKGSDAGTSLKTMLMNLSPSTKAQVAEFERLGIVTNDYRKAEEILTAELNKTAAGQALVTKMQKEGTLSADSLWKAADKLGLEVVAGTTDFNRWASTTGLMGNALFDAEGKAKSLGDIAGILQEKMAGMTKQQKLASLEIMFGGDAVRAAAVMAEAGAEGFTKMAEAIGNISARQVAEERLNNLSGSIEKMKGSAETFAIILGGKLTPMLKGMADAATEGINRAIVVLEDGWRTLEQVFAGQWEPSDSIDPIVNEIGKIGIVIRDQVIPAVQQAADYFMSTLVPAGRAVIEFMAEWWEVGAGVVAGLAALSVITTVAGWVTGAVAAWGALSGAVAASGSVIGGIVAILGGPLTIAVVGIAAAVGLLTAAWVGNWGDIQGKTASAVQAITGIINTGMAAWASFWTAHGDRITTVASAAWDMVKNAAQMGMTLINGIVQTGMQLLSGDWEGAWTTITETAAAIWAGWEAQISSALTIITALFGPAWEAISTTVAGYLDTINAYITTKMDEAKAYIDAGMAFIGGLFDAGWKAIEAVQTAAWNMLSKESQDNIIAIQQLFTELWQIAGQIWTAGTTAVARVVTEWWTKEVAEATQMYATLSKAAEDGWKLITDIWTRTTTEVARIVTEWWTKETEEATTMMTGISKVISDLLAPWVTYFSETFTKIKTEFGTAVTNLGNAASELGTKIMDALSAAIGAKVAEIVDKVTGSVRKALEGAKSLLGSFQWGAGGGGSSDAKTYLAQAAARKGIDPEQALAVMAKEGPMGWDSVGTFDTGTSYGPLQLHYAGGPNPKEGMGDRFTRDTGIDLRKDRSLQAQQAAIDYALSQVSAKGDWSEWYGADNALPMGRFTPVKRVTPRNGGVDPAGIQMMKQTQQEWAGNAADANSICGPYLASLFADAVGRPPNAAEAREIADAFGYGGTAGMLRNDQVDDMANAMIRRFSPTSGMRAVSQDITDPAAASQAMQRALAGGSPLVGINTQGHYFGADAYDPSSGKFHVGGTGTSIKGGAEWLTVDQMVALQGPLNGIITLTGQAGEGFTAMGTEAATGTGQTLLSTTTLANGATVAITQMGSDITTTVRSATGEVTGQWTTTVAGLVTGAQTAQAGTSAAFDIMTANSIVSAQNMGTGILTSVTDMAGNTIATTTNMSGQVTGLMGTLSSGVQVNMADMGTNVTSTVDAMTGHITTVMTDSSGNVVTTTTDMAGKVVDQWVALGTGVTTTQDTTAAQVIDTETKTSEDIRDINLRKNQELIKDQQATGRGLVEMTTTDLGITVERWRTAGGDIETTVRGTNGQILTDFMTNYRDIMAETDRTHTQLLATTTDNQGRTVELYREKTGEVVAIVTDSHGKIVEEYENTAEKAEKALESIEEFYSGIAEVPDVDMGSVVREYDRARKAAENFEKKAKEAAKYTGGIDKPGSKGRLSGGSINPGDMYWVGEGGRRELFISDRAGQILTENQIHDEGFAVREVEAAASGAKTVILNQRLNVQASPADLQRYTERAMRKLATEWGIE